MTVSKDVRVGYGRPPRHTQWKKGTSGNPTQKLSPKVESVVSMIDRLLLESVEMSISGKATRVTKLEAITLHLWAKEVAGDRKAFRARLLYERFANQHKQRRNELEFVDSDYTKAVAESITTSEPSNE